MDSWVRARSFEKFSIGYLGERLLPALTTYLPGGVWELEFSFRWHENGQNFNIYDKNGNLYREVYGEDAVLKFIECSLTPGLYDILPDGTAVWKAPQLIWDWQDFLIRDLKVFGDNNSQEVWNQVYAWADKLMDEGQLSLNDLDNAELLGLDPDKVVTPDLSGLGL